MIRFPVYNRFESLRSNVPLRVSFIFGCWLLTGILFYTYSQGWTFYNSYFYCINAGMSIGFGNLVERDYDPYLAFTVVYVLLGSTIVSGSIGFFFSYITSDSQGARVIQSTLTYTWDTVPLKWEDSPRSWLNALWYRAKYLSGWYSQRSLVKTLFLFLIWMSFGVIYGMVFERWSFIQSVYYVVTSCASGGLYGAPCMDKATYGTTKCDFGLARAAINATFCMLGVPIYAFTMANFAAVGVAYAEKSESRKRLYKEITLTEFNFACKLLSSSTSTTLTMGEFILLEFMRLGCVSADQIDVIKAKFQKLDGMVGNKGELSLQDLMDCKAMIVDKHAIRDGYVAVPLSSSSPNRCRVSSSRKVEIGLDSDREMDTNGQDTEAVRGDSGSNSGSSSGSVEMNELEPGGESDTNEIRSDRCSSASSLCLSAYGGGPSQLQQQQPSDPLPPQGRWPMVFPRKSTPMAQTQTHTYSSYGFPQAQFPPPPGAKSKGSPLPPPPQQQQQQHPMKQPKIYSMRQPTHTMRLDDGTARAGLPPSEADPGDSAPSLHVLVNRLRMPRPIPDYHYDHPHSEKDTSTHSDKDDLT